MPRDLNRVFRLAVERLEDRTTPAGFFAAGADAGGTPDVRVFDAASGAELGAVLAFDAAFTGGVRVAVGDVTADGVPDVVAAAGAGGGPHVKVFSGRDLSLVASFYAFDPSFAGGVYVAVGDVNADGLDDIVTGAGEGGEARVRVFDLSAGTVVPLAGPLGDFLAYDADFTGGVTVAAGNLDGRRGDEIVTGAGAGGGSHVKAFAADGTVVASFLAYAPGFTGGVFVAAGDVTADGADDIVTGAGAGGPHVKVFDGTAGGEVASFFAYDAATPGGVRVSAADLDADGFADVVTGAGPGGGPQQKVFGGATLGAAGGVLAFDAAFRGGIHVAAADLDTRGDPDLFQLTPEVPVLSRLARFVPSAVPALSNWVDVAASDPSLAGKNVYVVAHGWAPGFIDMVQAYTEDGLSNPPLKWWQTLDTFLPSSPGAPASPEMFYAVDGDGTVVSPTGLAYAITQTDPNAVVLAYSWIDESATGSTAGVPTDSYLSEAYTAMNGLRLSNALQLALPVGFAAGGGKLHLIGHSHGSKVATVATTALARTNDADFAVAHLSILDSPEVGSYLVRTGDAANNLWYFLGALDIGRAAGTTFVDNTISAFDSPIGTIQGFNPFATATTTAALQQVVDVTLNSGVLYGVTELGEQHGYAFAWYGGGGLAWAQNPTPAVAVRWSPLLNAATPATLAGSYTQTWTQATQPQFTLKANGPQPSVNTVTTTPAFTDLALSSPVTTPGATFAGSVVTLDEAGGTNPTFTGEFEPGASLSGISFNYQFANAGSGDQLVISVNTGFFGGFETYYVMTGTVAGTAAQFGTLSLTSLAGSSTTKIRVELVTAAGSGARVAVSNLQQFAV